MWSTVDPLHTHYVGVISREKPINLGRSLRVTLVFIAKTPLGS
jgi:hypothetical protein